MKKIILFLSLIICTSVYADFAAHEDMSDNEATECYRKFNDGPPIHVSINWNNSIVQVNNVYTSINGNLSNGAGISTTSFTNQTGSRAIFVIAYYPGYPVLLQMQVAESYHVDADGYGYHKILDHVWLSCTQSFVKPFKERMYRRQY